MDANLISINYNTQLVCANATRDTAGLYVGIPKFIDGEQEIQALEMCYNYASGRAKISSIYLEQEEWKTYGDTVLMDEDKNIFINDGTFCPCDDISDGTYIKSKQIKVIPDKKVITGPFSLYIADIPTPIGFIFGYFPMPKKKASGLIIPSYGEENTRGFFLRDGGYYWAVNDYVGVKVLGEYYSNGGYGLGADINYKNRYRYNGTMNFDYRNVVRNNDEYNRKTEQEDYSLRWSHRPIARNGKRFSAQVNLATTTFNSNNATATSDYLRSTMNSNISYSASIKRTPFSYTLNARHDQNNETGVFNFSLPSANLSMSRLNPLKGIVTGRKNANRDFLKSVGVSYNFNFDNKLTNQYTTSSTSYLVNNGKGEAFLGIDTIYDLSSAGTLEYMWKTKKLGMKHNIPLNASYKIGTALTINPSFTYTENWYTQHYEYKSSSLLNGEEAIQIDTVNALTRVGNYNTGLSLTNRMYGYYGFKGSKTTFRHVISPTIGFVYSPDYSERTDVYETVTTSTDTLVLDKYQNALYRPASGGKQSRITFRLTNAIEMKVVKNDSVNKKISLFDNIGVSSSYNFSADSLALNPFVFNANTNILGWVNFNSGMTVEPYLYQYDNELDKMVKVDRFAWKDSRSIGNVERANFALGSSLNPAKFKNDNKTKNEDFTNLDSLEKEVLPAVTSYAGLHAYDYINFSMPWNISVNYNFVYSNQPNSEEDITQTLAFSGNIKLTPKWDVALRTTYDFEADKFVYPNLTIHRDLGCWEMNINWVPFGPRTSYGIYINIKANSLKDLKYQKQNVWYDK